MPLDLDHLRRSLDVVSALFAVRESQTQMTELTDVERDGFRSGAIRECERTYELACKLLARWLNTNVTTVIATGETGRELSRPAGRHGLITNFNIWINHHEARNATSHPDDQEKAALVCRSVTDFAHDARRLLVALESRDD